MPDQLVNESSLEEGPSRDDSTDEVVRDTHRPSLCDGKSAWEDGRRDASRVVAPSYIVDEEHRQVTSSEIINRPETVPSDRSPALTSDAESIYQQD